MVRHPWVLPVALPAAVALVGALVFLLGRRITPEERERRRRLHVNAAGRIADGVVTDVQTFQDEAGVMSHVVHYEYDLNGVSYSAAQDITALLAHIPRDPQRIAGPAGVKYLPENPSNSIVICERWSGVR